MTTGYEQIYQNLINRIKVHDLEESAARLGLRCLPDQKIYVNFLKREFLITKDGVEPMDNKPVHINIRSVLLYYVLSCGSGEPEYSFVPLFRLTGMIEGRKDPTENIMSAPLIREFGNDLAKLKSAITKLGGLYEKISSGNHSWLISPLPKIPIKIIFYEADEEFPASIQIMFDKTAIRFMDFECLAFLCGCLVNALIEVAL